MRDYVTRFKCELSEKTLFMEIYNTAISAEVAETGAIEEAEEEVTWIGNQSIEWALVETKLKA